MALRNTALIFHNLVRRRASGNNPHEKERNILPLKYLNTVDFAEVAQIPPQSNTIQKEAPTPYHTVNVETRHSIET